MEEKEVFPLWSCSLKGFNSLQIDNLAEGPFVGDLRLLQCSGESSGLGQGEPPVFIYGNAEHKYIIKKVKDLKVADNEAEFLVTSYRPGEYSGIDLIVTNGLSGFRVDGLSISTKSVLTQEIKEPYPSFGPFQLNIPKLYSIGFSLVIILAVIIAAKVVTSYLSRRDFKAKMKKKHTPQTAYTDFTKSLRYWKRNELNEHNLKRKFVELDLIWSEYLEDSYFLPNNFNLNKKVKLFKKENKKLFIEHGLEFKKCCMEFKAANKDIEKLSIDGVHRLYKQALKVAGHFLDFYKGGKK